MSSGQLEGNCVRKMSEPRWGRRAWGERVVGLSRSGVGPGSAQGGEGRTGSYWALVVTAVVVSGWA